MINLHTLWLIFKRRFHIFFAVFSLAFALTLLITLQLTPLYKATASVIIDPQESDNHSFEALLSGHSPDSTLIDTEVEIIRSRALAVKVIDRLELRKDPEFNRTLLAPTGLNALWSEIRNWSQSLISDPGIYQNNADMRERVLEEKITNVLLSKLHVNRQGLTLVLKISAISETPSKAARIANIYAEQYLDEQLNAKFETITRSNAWLNERLANLREDVRTSESAVETYRAASGLLKAQGNSLTEQQISDLNAQLIIEKSKNEELEARLDSVHQQIAQGLGAQSIAEVLSSDVIRDLRRQQAEIARRKADLSSRYGTRHPDILQVEREAQDVAAQISLEVDRIVINLENETKIAAQKVRGIEQGLDKLRRELVENNRALVRLRELERDATANRTLYESFLERFKASGEQKSIAEADARIVSAAKIPTQQNSPNLLLNILLGLVLGFIFGFGMIFVVEVLDRKISSIDEIEILSGQSLIGLIPLINNNFKQTLSSLMTGKPRKDEKNTLFDYIIIKPFSAFAESFRTIRTTILLSNPDNPAQIITITSAMPNEGKTITTLCLGRISAMAGSKTLIIDCDLRRHKLSDTIHTHQKHEAGMLEYLINEARLEDIIITDEKSGCDILPLSQVRNINLKDIFGSDAFTRLLERLRADYHQIFLDSAPLFALADTRQLVHLSDGVIVLTKWRQSHKTSLVNIIKTLNSLKANIIGVLVNQVDMKSLKLYDSAHAYYYNEAYHHYYAE